MITTFAILLLLIKLGLSWLIITWFGINVFLVIFIIFELASLVISVEKDLRDDERRERQ